MHRVSIWSDVDSVTVDSSEVQLELPLIECEENKEEVGIFGVSLSLFFNGGPSSKTD